MPANQAKFITRCRLKKEDGSACGHVITDYALPLQPPGSQPDPRMVTFIQALMKHLSKRHAKIIETIERDGSFLSAFLAVGMFETEDPALRRAVTSFATYLRNITRLPSIPDDHFEAMAKEYGLAPEDPKHGVFVRALQNVRDYYEGKWMPPDESQTEPEPEKLLVSP